MAKICRHCFISGKVQGVFYRQYTKEQALAYNITGWVKNLPDGRVEALISGEDEHVADMLRWLAIGPPKAQVNSVEINESEYTDFSNFKIL